MARTKEFVGAEQLLLTRVIKQDSVAFAFGGSNPMWIAWWLKVLGKTVHVNDILQFSYWDAVGMVENDGDVFDEDSLAELTKGLKKEAGKVTLANPELQRLVGKDDAYFFDQLRSRIEELPPTLKGMAIRAGYLAIRYVQILDTSAAYGGLRQPVEEVFNDTIRLLNARVTGNGAGYAYREEASRFVREPKADVLFLQLPTSEGLNLDEFKGERVAGPVGRELWASGPASGWLQALRDDTKDRFGDKLLSKTSYEGAFKQLLEGATGYPLWVFAIKESEYAQMLSVLKGFRKPQAVHRFDGRGASGGHMNLFVIA